MFCSRWILTKFPLNCLYDKDSKRFLWEIYADTCFTQTPSATIFGLIKRSVNKGAQKQFSKKILIVADSKIDENQEALAISKVFEKQAHVIESDKLSSIDLSKALTDANVQTFHFIGHGMFLEMAPMLGLLYLGNREFLTAAVLLCVYPFTYISADQLGADLWKEDSSKSNRAIKGN